MLSDLRESGQIEQDADLVIFIYRDEYYNPETPSARARPTCIIAKHRNGGLGDVPADLPGRVPALPRPAARGMIDERDRARSAPATAAGFVVDEDTRVATRRAAAGPALVERRRARRLSAVIPRNTAASPSTARR